MPVQHIEQQSNSKGVAYRDQQTMALQSQLPDKTLWLVDSRPLRPPEFPRMAKLSRGIDGRTPRTAPLAVLMSLPYAFNILLYVTFFAHQYLVIGIPDFAACTLLIYCYFDWY
ncbi:hypothetical protein [Rhodopirellula halodulae]|uniref:hypothetical protein n=1 Tax=Rhodopirellula halodulae TaxID=2894198 RepID=UPI001E655B5D|nr:hypothetical protein [Rhodopirellula sp. JC737]MCC9655187.1 hypothetical protein [Rhodopirellula sp. JC737]